MEVVVSTAEREEGGFRGPSPTSPPPEEAVSVEKDEMEEHASASEEAGEIEE